METTGSGLAGFEQGSCSLSKPPLTTGSRPQAQLGAIATPVTGTQYEAPGLDWRKHQVLGLPAPLQAQPLLFWSGSSTN